MLVLPIKKKWFEMIEKGQKKEEYREIKPYYDKRIGHYAIGTGKITTLVLRNGYSYNSPAIKCKCSISIGTGIEGWGAELNINYYVIKILKILEVRNYEV